MITIRAYRDDDTASVGRLIARTYAAFNLGFAAPGQGAALLGPFRFAESTEPGHRSAIAEVLQAPVALVAEDAGAIVGVLRGGRLDWEGRTVLQSLFVDADHHRGGSGAGWSLGSSRCVCPETSPWSSWPRLCTPCPSIRRWATSDPREHGPATVSRAAGWPTGPMKKRLA